MPHIAGLLFLTWAGPRLFVVMGVLCGIFRKQPSMVTGVTCYALIHTAVILGISLEISEFGNDSGFISA